MRGGQAERQANGEIRAHNTSEVPDAVHPMPQFVDIIGASGGLRLMSPSASVTKPEIEPG